MARPQKQTVEYFPHECDTDNSRTLTILENKYGNDGFTFWFKLLQFLGRRDGLYFDYNNPADLEFLCAKTRQKDTETVLRLLADLDVVGAIDHELYLEKVIWCQNFVDGVADAFKRSVSGIPQRPTPKTAKMPEKGITVPEAGQTVGNMQTETPKNNTETPQTKLKEIKVKESKENSSCGSNDFSSEGLISENTNITQELFGLYEDNIQQITPTIQDEIRAALAIFPPDKIEFAIKEAARKNHCSWSYIAGILNNGYKSPNKQKTAPKNELILGCYTVTTCIEIMEGMRDALPHIKNAIKEELVKRKIPFEEKPFIPVEERGYDHPPDG